MKSRRICEYIGRHLWVPPWWSSNRHCAVCGKIESLDVGSESISISPPAVGDVIRWSGSQPPLAMGDIGMDATTGRIQMYVGGSAKNCQYSGEVSQNWSITGGTPYTHTGASVQSVTFATGLDGNTDGVYMLVYRILTGSSSGTDYYYLRPNALAPSSDSKSVVCLIQNVSTSVNTDVNNERLGYIAYNAGHQNMMTGNAYIFASNSAGGASFQRSYSNVAYAAYGGANVPGAFVSSGRWENNSTNITSLQVYGSTATAIAQGSQFWLFKI